MTLILSYLLYSNFETYAQKRFHQKLSGHLVVYARDRDPVDTLIIRDRHENTNLTCFGIKSFETINRFYILLWDILAQLSDASLKYIETRDDDDDYERNEQTIIAMYGTKIVYTLDDLIQIEYYKEQKQFMMFNLKKQRIDCGVVIELSHVIELVDYMSKRFHFYNFLSHETNMYMYDEFFSKKNILIKIVIYLYSKNTNTHTHM